MNWQRNIEYMRAKSTVAFNTGQIAKVAKHTYMMYFSEIFNSSIKVDSVEILKFGHI